MLHSRSSCGCCSPSCWRPSSSCSSADYLQRLGLGDFDSEGRWLEFFQALRPFVQVALVLVSLLLVAGLLTLRRVARGRRLPQPAPLAAGDEARRVGMDEAELIAARELRIVVVHIEPDGKHRIEPRQAAPP